MTAKFTAIDGMLMGDGTTHSFLHEDDECYFLIEYTSNSDYSFSKANNLISNLKKEPSKKGKAEWRYKVEAMNLCSKAFGEAINRNWLNGAVLVPVPPSKAKTDPEYDDRMKAICEAIPADFDVDVRELIVQSASYEAFHVGGHRLKPDELVEIYEIDEDVTNPEPVKIGIVDDVITNGSHYRAMHTVLKERFPNAHIVGFFVARRVFPPNMVADDFDEV